MISVCQHIPPAAEESAGAGFCEDFTWDRGRLKEGSDSLISRRTLRRYTEGGKLWLCWPEARTSDSTFLPDTRPLGCKARYLSETIPSQRLLCDNTQPLLGSWCDPLPSSVASFCFVWGLWSDPVGFGAACCGHSEMAAWGCSYSTLGAVNAEIVSFHLAAKQGLSVFLCRP